MIDASPVDEGILAALVPAAHDLEVQTDGAGETSMILWAVVVYAYVDADGEVQHAYRRVNASWFDVGGAAQFLASAEAEAWRQENDSG